MYAGHVATAMALRGRARQVPMAAYVGGALLLDILWVSFGVAGLDRTPWTDWSHSLVMAMIWATLFASLFAKAGRVAVAALWIAVVSHFVLDLVVQGASLYPFAPKDLLIPVLVAGTPARLLQLLLSAMLLLIFVLDERRAGLLSGRTWIAAGLVMLLNGRFLAGLG